MGIKKREAMVKTRREWRKIVLEVNIHKEERGGGVEAEDEEQEEML
jgi:hypothetical protein